VLFVLANLFYWGIRATLRQLNIPLVVLDIPYAWVYVVVPVTAVLMTVRTLAVMREDVQRYRHGDALEPDVRGVV
jgi:TRAP-type C4-dicarboxylate transport system permease small subunit